MANGPKSADVVQNYILQSMRKSASGEMHELVARDAQMYEGVEAWSIGSVFDKGVLEDFEESDDDFSCAEESFQELDLVYDAIKTTNSGGNRYRKIEGLHSFTGDGEMPSDNRKTVNNWINDYRDAGLLEDGEVTDRGVMIIESTDELDENVFSDLKVGAGEAYQKIVTKGYGSTEENNGRKIQAFLMYGVQGMSHTDIADSTGMSESTSRSMAEDLNDYGLLTDNYMFTAEGRDFAKGLVCQINDL